MTDDTFCRLKPPLGGVTALWKLQGLCNLRCHHCLVNDRKASRPPLAETLPRLKRASVTRVVLTGGEPLLAPDLDSIIAALHEAGISISLLTNGMLLDARKAAGLARSGLDSVCISLYSHDAGTHDAIAGLAGSWRSAVAAMDACRHEALKFSVSTVLLPRNERDLASLIFLAKQHGAASVSVNSFLPHSTAPAALREWVRTWDPAKAADLIQRLRSGHAMRGFIKTSGLLPASDREFRCPAGLQFVGITEEGQWVPCLPAHEAGWEPSMALSDAPCRCPLLDGTRSADLYGTRGVDGFSRQEEQ